MGRSKASGFYTSREAAKALGVSTTTIQLWVESGVLPAWKTAGGHRRIPSEAIDAILLKQQTAVSQEEKAHNTHSVLVVEDDPVQSELFRIKFEEWGMPIDLYLATNGFDGLLMAGKYSPDLIITDLSMPGMDGFEMIKHILDSNEIRIHSLIVVTALSTQEIEAFGGLPKDIPIYSKSVPLAVLKPIVEKILQPASN